MAKTKVSEWDSNASGNTDINGININEGCPPSTINNAIRETMAQVKDLVDGSSGDSLTNSGTLTSSGTLAVTGNFTVDGSSGTSGQFLTSVGSGATPTWTTLTAFVSGMIMLWSGSEASIPSGWVLCDGTNSTPNLQDRFVVGAGNTYAVDATGGSNSADHTHTTGEHTLTINEIPAHEHYVQRGATGSSATWLEGYSFNSGGQIPVDEKYASTYSNAEANRANSSSTGGGASHNHGNTGTTAIDNRPPYYALCYIMKS